LTRFIEKVVQALNRNESGRFGALKSDSTHHFFTNLKGEKRRNVGKLNNELYIVNQLVDLHFLLFVNITGN
jgi:hypothetical protein